MKAFVLSALYLEILVCNTNMNSKGQLLLRFRTPVCTQRDPRVCIKVNDTRYGGSGRFRVVQGPQVFLSAGYFIYYQ